MQTKFIGIVQNQYLWEQRKQDLAQEDIAKEVSADSKFRSWNDSLEYQLSQRVKAFAPLFQLVMDAVCLQGGCVTMGKGSFFSGRQHMGKDSAMSFNSQHSGLQEE